MNRLIKLVGYASKVRLVLLPILAVTFGLQLWTMMPWWLQYALTSVWGAFRSLPDRLQFEIIVTLLALAVAYWAIRKWWMHAALVSGIVMLLPGLPFSWKVHLLTYGLPVILLIRYAWWVYISDRRDHYRPVHPMYKDQMLREEPKIDWPTNVWPR